MQNIFFIKKKIDNDIFKEAIKIHFRNEKNFEPCKMENKVVAIIQARMSSSRLPGKVLKKVQNKTLIEILIYRLLLSKRIDKIIIAITLNTSDDILARHLDEKGYQYFRGNEQNVLDRYYKAAIQTNASTIVRITGDCPLIDPSVVDSTIEKFLKKSRLL